MTKLTSIDLETLSDDAKAVAGGWFGMMSPGKGAVTHHMIEHRPTTRAQPAGVGPNEPTEAMLDAGVALALSVTVSGEGGWTRYIKALYETMEAARMRGS